jgi:hypothetical protein
MSLRNCCEKSSLIDCPRFRHLVSRLHALGPRPVGEFIAALYRQHDDLPVLELLERYARSDPATIRVLGADRWPVGIFVVGDIRSGSATHHDITRATLPADGGDDAA